MSAPALAASNAMMEKLAPGFLLASAGLQFVPPALKALLQSVSLACAGATTEFQQGSMKGIPPAVLPFPSGSAKNFARSALLAGEELH